MSANVNGKPDKGQQRGPWLTPAEAAAYLALSEGSLRNWRSAGTGPAYSKAAGRVRYRSDDLDAFMDAGRVVARYGSVAAH